MVYIQNVQSSKYDSYLDRILAHFLYLFFLCVGAFVVLKLQDQKEKYIKKLEK